LLSTNSTCTTTSRREAEEAKRKAGKLEADLAAAASRSEELGRELDNARERENAAAAASKAREAELYKLNQVDP
jgi:hypothetical protein